MKNHFSKSKYCRLWQCPKMLWMDKYKPEEKAEDATDDSRMEAGTEVGKLAREVAATSKKATARARVRRMINSCNDSLKTIYQEIGSR